MHEYSILLSVILVAVLVFNNPGHIITESFGVLCGADYPRDTAHHTKKASGKGTLIYTPRPLVMHILRGSCARSSPAQQRIRIWASDQYKEISVRKLNSNISPMAAATHVTERFGFLSSPRFL